MLDKYYKQNVIGISAVEFLWGLGLPVVIESTFLQLFLKSLGASSFQVGLIPAFFFVGLSIFALLASYFTSDTAFKRAAVIYLHILSGISLVFFGRALFIFGQFLDHFAWLGGDAYRIIFGVAMMLIAGSLMCILRVDFRIQGVQDPRGRVKC